MRGLRAAARWLLSGPAVRDAAQAAWARCYSAELPDSLLPVVAIIGRPNVGKSALFNRLVRRREALVHDTPGGHVTRDYKEGVASLADLRFRAVDTSGLEPFLPGHSIQARATALTHGVLRRCDVALFLFDGSTGVLPADEQLARWLRREVLGGGGAADPASASSSGGSTAGGKCALLLVANKCERRGGGEGAVTAALAESMRLGLGEPVALSAMTGEGMTELYAALQPLLDPLTQARQAAVQEPVAGSHADARMQGLGAGQQQPATGMDQGLGSSSSSSSSSSGSGSDSSSSSGGSRGQSMKIAIMGLPNVGKSTLTNWLLQEERCLTGPEPGLTRDAVRGLLSWQGRQVELVDTAGWVRRTHLARYDDCGGAVAAATVAEARRSMHFAHVVALLVDAERALELGEGLTHREVTLASSVVAEGRLLLLVANKLDALAPHEQERALELVADTARRALPDVSGVPVLGMSALTGSGAEGLLPAAVQMYERWCQRVPTARLNRWVEKAAPAYTSGGGKELGRITYISQVKARPPTFVAWVSGSTPFSTAAQRFVANQIRREFGLGGVPIRLSVRLKQARRARRSRS